MNFKTISEIFSGFLADTPTNSKSGDKLYRLVESNIQTNQKLWKLEDSAKMIDLGLEHVANAKQEIDKNNQIRNDLIRGEIDIEIADQINASSVHQERFYSESPGMIIDRLAILFIKLSVIRELLSIIKEKDLKKEYKEKEDIILKQIDRLGNFLDSYFNKLKHKEIFFEIQQPVKIYNDKRIREYIKILKKEKPAKQN